jgi:DNA-binding transcriptional regulator YhcF (GntR family)
VILRIDATAPTPPYAQLLDQLTTMIRTGVLAEGHQLPPIRHLANDLGLAPNTVARVYRELEGAGLVRTRGRHGTVVAAIPSDEQGAPDAIGPLATTLALEARQRGIDLDQLVEVVGRAFRDLDHGTASP